MGELMNRAETAWHWSTLVLGILGLVASSLAIVAGCKTRQRSHTKYLLHGLATSQAGAVLIAIISVIIHMAGNRNCVTFIACTCIFHVLLMAFSFTIVAMTLDVFGAVFNPIYHKTKVYRRHALIALSLIWLVSILIGAILAWMTLGAGLDDVSSLQTSNATCYCDPPRKHEDLSDRDLQAAHVVRNSASTYFIVLLILSLLISAGLIALLVLIFYKSDRVILHSRWIVISTYKNHSILGARGKQCRRKAIAFSCIAPTVVGPWIANLAVSIAVAQRISQGKSNDDIERLYLGVVITNAFILFGFLLTPLFSGLFVPEIRRAYRMLFTHCCPRLIPRKKFTTIRDKKKSVSETVQNGASSNQNLVVPTGSKEAACHDNDIVVHL